MQRSDLERRIAEALAPRQEVLEAYLFGSHATGRAQAHSDIDVAVYVDERRAAHGGYGYAAELGTALMAALGTNALDVTVLNRAPPVLYHRVLRDGRRLLSRDLRATTTREGYALSRYCDYVPQLAKIEDAVVVRRHLSALREALRHLQRHADATPERLRADADLRWTVERGLQLCAQNVLDVATHVAAASALDAPDYATAIDRLAELDVLPRDFASRLRAIAGFRNVLVHGYLQVDLDIVAGILREKLSDFEAFARHVEAHLTRG
jgi:uncharacterized protein YutE (UPF0331/DUF86 family)/predicted nucleotidyltransferase